MDQRHAQDRMAHHTLKETPLSHSRSTSFDWKTMQINFENTLTQSMVHCRSDTAVEYSLKREQVLVLADIFLEVL